jgi:hypothetical protein
MPAIPDDAMTRVRARQAALGTLLLDALQVAAASRAALDRGRSARAWADEVVARSHALRQRPTDESTPACPANPDFGNDGDASGER